MRGPRLHACIHGAMNGHIGPHAMSDCRSRPASSFMSSLPVGVFPTRLAASWPRRMYSSITVYAVSDAALHRARIAELDAAARRSAARRPSPRVERRAESGAGRPLSAAGLRIGTASVRAARV